MDTLELTIPGWKPPNRDAFVLGCYYAANEAAVIPQLITSFGFKSPQEHFTRDYYLVGEEDEYDDSTKCIQYIKSWKVVFHSDFEEETLDEKLTSLITKVCMLFQGETVIKVFKDESSGTQKVYEAKIEDGDIKITKRSENQK